MYQKRGLGLFGLPALPARVKKENGINRIIRKKKTKKKTKKKRKVKRKTRKAKIEEQKAKRKINLPRERIEKRFDFENFGYRRRDESCGGGAPREEAVEVPRSGRGGFLRGERRKCVLCDGDIGGARREPFARRRRLHYWRQPYSSEQEGVYLS